MICTEFYLRTKTLEYRIEVCVYGVVICHRRGYRIIECEYLIKHRRSENW